MNTQDLINGDNIFLYLSESAITSANTGDVLAFATSCSLEANGETIDTSSKLSCRWQSNLPGRNSYSVSADALYTQSSATGFTGFDKLMKIMISGDEIYWAMGLPTSGTSQTENCDSNTFVLDTSKPYYTGVATIATLSLTAGNNEVATSSISLTGDGAIAQHGVS